MIEPHKAIGYATVVDRLKRVQHICGVERVYTILAHNGVPNRRVSALHPRTYPSVICECESAVLCARVWEALLTVKEQVINPPRAARFKDAVDLWMTTCDLELRLLSPELYSDRGEPL